MAQNSYSQFSRNTARRTPGVTVGAIALPRGQGAIALPRVHGAIALPVTAIALPVSTPTCPSNGRNDIGDIPEPYRSQVCNEYWYATDPAVLIAEAKHLATSGYAMAAHRLLTRAHSLKTVSVVPTSATPYYNPRTNRYG